MDIYGYIETQRPTWTKPVTPYIVRQPETPASPSSSSARTRQNSFASSYRTRKSSSASSVSVKSPKSAIRKNSYTQPNFLPLKPLDGGVTGKPVSPDPWSEKAKETPKPPKQRKQLEKAPPKPVSRTALPRGRPQLNIVTHIPPVPKRPERPLPPPPPLPTSTLLSALIQQIPPPVREPPNIPLPPIPAKRKSPVSTPLGRVRAELVPSPTSEYASDISSKTTPKMLSRPGTAHGPTQGTNGSTLGGIGPGSPTLETITYQHIQEMASKRISTLDYLRKANEGRVYWFNTVLFNKADLQRIPYFEPRKLARRAANYLLLGVSIPIIVDLNASNPSEFLRCLNALLVEFETYQQIHPPDGSTSLSRGRFPQMFKRTTVGGKNRRASSAADIGLPMGNDSADGKQSNGGSTPIAASGNSYPTGEGDLLPGEEYTYLLTPSLPFDPDYYETFATLCDVLIDCYTKLLGLVASPKECTPSVAEMFTKADAKVRKIIVQGVVKEFEDSSRAGAKNEVAGVGRVILGGLM